MLSTLELLQETERLLVEDDGEEFVFADWSRCTCGFIYAARNNGEFLPSLERSPILSGTNVAAHDAMERDPVYAEAIKSVAYVLGWEGPKYDVIEKHGGSVTQQAMGYVSDKTGQLSSEGFGYHDAALTTVREAITKIEAHEEAARLKIIDDSHFAAIV